jgi:3-carboxy-cis,cis-muconate cycloisomerase
LSASLTSRTLARPSFETAFQPPAFLRAMLAFESALATAQAEEGLIPASSAALIASTCGKIEFDVEALVAEAKRSATLVVPFIASLRCAVAKADAAAAKHVHFGATTQDVLDTAMALCLKPCLEEADRSLEGAIRAFARRALEHRATPMLGRTLMQPAVAMSAGVKIARWALALAGDRERIGEAQAAGLAVQCGGPIGTQQGLGRQGPRRAPPRGAPARARGCALVAGASQRLDRPPRPRRAPGAHVRQDRARHLAAHAGRGRRDARIPAAGRRGSLQRDAAQAQSRRLRARARCATRMAGHLATLHASGLSEHERALGGWQAELALVPDIVSSLGSALDFLDTLAASLVVDAARMKANLDAYGAPGTLVPGDEATMEELLAELNPYLT